MDHITISCYSGIKDRNELKIYSIRIDFRLTFKTSNRREGFQCSRVFSVSIIQNIPIYNSHGSGMSGTINRNEICINITLVFVPLCSNAWFHWRTLFKKDAICFLIFLHPYSKKRVNILIFVTDYLSFSRTRSLFVFAVAYSGAIWSALSKESRACSYSPFIICASPRLFQTCARSFSSDRAES